MGFLGEQLLVNGYITLKTIFGANDRVRLTKVKYMVINNVPSSHNMATYFQQTWILPIYTIYLHEVPTLRCVIQSYP